jgi:hypothetical protein
MEHALHLVAKHFIEEVAPTPASILHKKAAQAEDEDEDSEESVEFDIGDTIGKALAFVAQVSSLMIYLLLYSTDTRPLFRSGSLLKLASSFKSAARR